MMQPEIDPNKIALIGVPSSAGARQVGQEQAPQSLRAAGLVQRLQSWS
jgi:arginase family enzyme